METEREQKLPYLENGTPRALKALTIIEAAALWAISAGYVTWTAKMAEEPASPDWGWIVYAILIGLLAAAILTTARAVGAGLIYRRRRAGMKIVKTTCMTECFLAGMGMVFCALVVSRGAVGLLGVAAYSRDVAGDLLLAGQTYGGFLAGVVILIARMRYCWGVGYGMDHMAFEMEQNYAYGYVDKYKTGRMAAVLCCAGIASALLLLLGYPALMARAIWDTLSETRWNVYAALICWLETVRFFLMARCHRGYKRAHQLTNTGGLSPSGLGNMGQWAIVGTALAAFVVLAILGEVIFG